MIAGKGINPGKLKKADLFLLVTLLALACVVPVSATGQENATASPQFITIDPVGTPPLGGVFTLSGTTNLPPGQAIEVIVVPNTPMMPKIVPDEFVGGIWYPDVAAGEGNTPNLWSVEINSTGYTKIFGRTFWVGISSPASNVTNSSEFNFAEPHISIDSIGNHTVGDVFFINGTTNLPVTAGPLVFQIADANANPGGWGPFYRSEVPIQAGENGTNAWSVNATVGPGWGVYPTRPNESIAESVSGSLGITQDELMASVYSLGGFYSDDGVTAVQTFYLSPGESTVSSPALPPVASFGDFFVSGSPGANTLLVHFEDTSTNSPVSWFWSFGDESTSTLQNPTHTYAGGDTYVVTLKVTNGVGSTMTSETVDLLGQSSSPTPSSPFPTVLPIAVLAVITILKSLYR